MTHYDGTFNAAVREAVIYREHWTMPAVIWIGGDETHLWFEAQPDTVPGPGEKFIELTADTLAVLAEMLDDPQEFDEFVSDILVDAEANHRVSQEEIP